MEIKKVGIAGFGEMGGGIAEVVARAGLAVAVWGEDETSIERGKSLLNDSMDKAIESGKIKKEEKEAILARLTLSKDLSRLKESDIVIEAFPEDMELKKKVFSGLSDIIPESAILATTTTTLSITEIAHS
ncbi:MAG: 3-hydroxyacyl-CoA dehydrogenase NAD-binding domain-containing protein, partial [Pseudomonadota bacterium]